MPAPIPATASPPLTLAPPVDSAPPCGGLLAWAAGTWVEVLAASPLPSARSRVGRGRWPDAWQVGDLPAAPLVTDLTALGVTYRHSLGWTIGPDRVDRDEVGRTLARLLDDVATGLPEPPRATLSAGLDEYRDASRANRLQGVDLLEEVTPGDWRPHDLVALDWTGPTRRALARWLANTPPDDPADVERVDAWRVALGQTAASLRNSAAARKALVDRLRPLVTASAPPTPATDTDAASTWLATLDGRASLNRADLPGLYAAAGNPGGLNAAALRTLAATRWGAAVKVRGTYLHRPARATTEEAP